MVPFFARNIMMLGDQYGFSDFFDIYGFTTDWRNHTNQGGQDAVFYILIVVFGYNILDMLIFGFYLFWFNLVARSRRERIRAMKSLPVRFASKYVYLLVVYTFVLTFAHVQPKILFIILFYFPIQSLVMRFILLRISS